VVVAGYQTPFDSGGGEFGVGAACANTSILGASISSTSLNTVLVSSTSGLALGYAITDSSGVIPQGAQVSSIIANTSFTITQSAAAPITGDTVNVFGNNGGTIIQDNSPTVRCWYKTNYRGEPHEWGAVGDGSANDTIPIQDWLGADGAAVSKYLTQAPTNFGPWIATVPANYLVSGPLICPPNANIEAPANLASANLAALPGWPPVRIFTKPFGTAPNSYTNTSQPGLMVASAYCRLSGIALDASNIGNFYLTSPGTATNSGSTGQITGVPNVAGVWAGMPINDGSAHIIPDGTYVASITGTSPYTLNLSQEVNCSTSWRFAPLNDPCSEFDFAARRTGCARSRIKRSRCLWKSQTMDIKTISDKDKGLCIGCAARRQEHSTKATSR
jgi:hypothetical protein